MKCFGCKTILMVLAFAVFFSRATSKSVDLTNETQEKWMKIDKEMKSGVQSVIKQIMPMLLESSERVNITNQCTKDLFQLITGLRGLKTWAFSFVDSSAKMVDGVLSGSVTNLGVYDQCVKTKVPNPRKKDQLLFQGQYCRVDVNPPLPKKTRIYRLYDRLEELRNFSGSELMTDLSKYAHLFYFYPVKLGVCIPSGCTENDLSQILNVATENLHLEPKVRSCEIEQGKKELLGAQIFAIFVSCALVSLVLVGTAVEKLSNSETENSLHRFLLCFSAVRNFKKLTSTKSNSKKLGCLHGIKFLSITWVIFGHAYLYPSWFLAHHRELFSIQNITTESFAQTIVNSSMVVDTFLFVSGMLVSYLSVEHVIVNKKKFNLILFVVHRLWRVIPVYYFLVLFVFLIPLMGSGPVFQETLANDITTCYTNWWRNLLFINNFFHLESICLMHSWYISCDIQLYMASLLVLLPMFRSEKIGVAINVFLIILSVLYTAYVVGVKNASFLIVNFFIDPIDQNRGALYVYSNTLTRAGPYFIGFLVGYILARKPDLKIPKSFQMLGWCLAILSSALVLYATAIWMHVRFPSKNEILLYACLYHVAFAGGVAWMTFCCCTGRGGFINTILSWKLWTPLSKLTFSMYLTQPIFQTAYISLYRSAREYTHMINVVNAFGFILISGLLAVLLSLLVETPFLAMEKLLFHKPRTDEKHSNEQGIDLSSNGHKASTNGNAYKSYQNEHNLDNHAFDSKE